MSDIFVFLTSFCITAAALGALYILLPEGSFSKPVKYAFCVCFLCCILSGFSVKFKSNYSFNNEIDYTDFTSYYEKSVEQTFKTALENSKISFENIKVIASKSESGGIVINEVIVYSAENTQKIVDVIGNNGYEVTVINE